MRVTQVTHNQTNGTFHMICTNTVSLKPVEQHKTKFQTQFWTDSDFALNRIAVTAEIVSGGSLGQLNQRRALLRQAAVPPSFYEQQKKRVATAAEELGKEEVHTQWEAFKKLPWAEKVIEIDMRHASARASKQSTFEALVKGSHKIVFILNVITAEDTGNAWRNEVLGVMKLLQQCYDQRVSLRTLAHDSCSKTSKLLLQYNLAMAKRAAGEGTAFVPCIDANDAWHGTKSWKKLWAKIRELFTKPRHKKTTKVQITDDKSTINQKEIAARQLRAVTHRIEGLIIPICEAAKDQPKLAIDTLRRMIAGCLIADDHTLCEKVCGEDCACVVSKRVRTNIEERQTPEERAAAATPFSLEDILDETDNPYLIAERVENRIDELTYTHKPKRSKKSAPPEEVDEDMRKLST